MAVRRTKPCTAGRRRYCPLLAAPRRRNATIDSLAARHWPAVKPESGRSLSRISWSIQLKTAFGEHTIIERDPFWSSRS
eukprot:7294445-Pyramimonas_sp.AAC.1